MQNPLESEDRIVKKYIFRTWRYDKDGNRLYAKDYGFKAWRIPVFK